eukprot:TRINITY_DN86786_c0_g1_i1.p1 TRINITY_DN86786_c0_g1~~TRINITY_DN86786_c0_g1_i1.p1  ORF type:complete len:114 (+),score=15.80 TRINITY_DN86786_c0_g1_i1:48-344(+)
MPFLKIVFNSFATGAFTAIVAGIATLFYAFFLKPNQGAVGEGIIEAVGIGLAAGVAGLILGAAGSLLFPASYWKYLVLSVLLVAGLGLLGGRVISQLR